MSAVELQDGLAQVVNDTGARFTREGVTSIVARVYAVMDLPDGGIVIITRPLDPVYEHGWQGKVTGYEKQGDGWLLTRTDDEGALQVHPLGDINPDIIADGKAAPYTFEDALAEAQFVPLEAW